MSGIASTNGPVISFPLTLTKIFNAHVTRRSDMAYSTATWNSFPYNFTLYPIRGISTDNISVHCYSGTRYYIVIIGT